jgi:hypothetical protein
MGDLFLRQKEGGDGTCRTRAYYTYICLPGKRSFHLQGSKQAAKYIKSVCRGRRKGDALKIREIKYQGPNVKPGLAERNTWFSERA